MDVGHILREVAAGTSGPATLPTKQKGQSASSKASPLPRSVLSGPFLPIIPPEAVVAVVMTGAAALLAYGVRTMMARRLASQLLVVFGFLLPVGFAPAESDLYRPVDLRESEAGDRRLYLSGILGSSWGTLVVDEPPSINEPLFTAGGAAGVAFERAGGRLRLEFEGRYRDPIGEAVEDVDSAASVRAANGWSTLVNAWRDIDLTDRFGIYVGGGIGGGGYGALALQGSVPAENFTVNGSGSMSGFAWQAGGGAIYEITDRVTFDLGYRFFAVDSGAITATSRQSGVPIETFAVDTGFSASELLFTIRVYEPFRGWR